MNCKPGDLAMVVESECGNEGKVVRCVRYIGEVLWRNMDGGIYWESSWEIDQPLLGIDGSLEPFISDSQLRPIRDPGDDARDETLDWLPSPSREKERA